MAGSTHELHQAMNEKFAVIRQQDGVNLQAPNFNHKYIFEVLATDIL
jgi:hypothetical protein